jgi:hypothetical protein
MGTAQEALDMARSFIGLVEGPGNNQTIFGEYTGYNYQPWCGSFCKYILDKTGTGGEPSPVYTPSGVQGYRSVGRFIPRNGNPEPGDLVFFDWAGGQSAGGTDHVGMVEAVLPDGRIQTIEGNTSSGSSGSQSDGGGVWRRIRTRGNIVGFGHPNYSGPASSNPVGPNGEAIDWAAVRRLAARANLDSLSKFPANTILKRGDRNLMVTVLQKSLNVATGRRLVEDGDYGPATQSAVTDFQKFFKLEADGVMGNQTRFMLAVCLKNIAEGKA